MDKIIVRKTKHPNQCEIMVGRRRVGYVCYGDRMPINFLSKAASGLKLTEGEKLEVAKETRRQMADLNAERRKEELELQQIAGKDYFYSEGPIANAPDENGNPPVTGKAEKS